ncbi:CS1-pili formation C-terminal domain-containing protein [Vibrio alginolyticus]|uniref:CS1-pili formation C-terminal domain-containing protein n=1 Tax=Vibrio alginolyticus TaxID=663 RepID=UPI00215C2D50|nr:CS1-pili formation C-terminal domain-containing protein [Vibrio alginolyticus]MCR9352121.1 CS1-pili formation C-terminal domain-containing protein [Vibrio alginolyticus]MCR9362556.1 CS1-pili formation C-terminal domain-containing protein [Vibrio alginolyticus]
MKSYLLVSSLFISINVLAAPPGFEVLTALTPSDITLTVNDDNSLSLPGEIGAQSVRFNANVQERLHAFLLEQYLKPEVAKRLSIQLIDGADTSVLCKGRRDSCLIDESEAEVPQFVIVYDLHKVRLLVPSALMAKQVEQARFIDDAISDNAMIMHHDFNVGSGSNVDAYGHYGGSLIAGVGGGFFRGDINVTSEKHNTRNDSYFYADEMTWNYLTENWRTQVGYVSDRNDESWNATGLLDTDEKVNSVRVSLGSTSELEFKSKATADRLYFSVPSSGRLKVTREDGTPVLERNVSAGQQYLSYDDLPGGITTLIISLESGGQEVFRDVRKIYNTANSHLRNGDFDVLFSAGLFQRQDIFPDWVEEEYSYNDDDWNNEGYLQAQVVEQVNDSWQVGASLLNTRDTHYLKLATQFQPVSWFSANVVVGQFGSGSRYNQVSGSLGGVTLNWSQYRDDTMASTDELALDHYLYGLGSYEEWSLGWNHHLWKGNAYLYYSSYHQEQDASAYRPGKWIEEQYQDNSSLTVGYSWQGPWRSTIDSNLMKTSFNGADGPQSDEWTFNLNISIPLNASGMDYVNYNLADQYNEDFSSQYHRVTYGHRFDVEQGANLSMEVSGTGHTGDRQSIGDTMIGDMTFSGGYQNDQWRGSAMIYADTDSEYNGYADMQTTTVLSGGDLYQSRKQADSYLLVTNSGDQSPSLDKGGDKFLTTVQLKENNESGGRLVIDKTQVVHPLNSYKEYQVTVDDSSSDYHNRGERFVQGSSFPGTALRLNVDNREVRSYISVFSSVEGLPIDEVTCVGDGCVSVETLTEGVFKFRVSKGLPFQLKTSLNQRCFIPSPSSTAHQNLGQNFCMPQFESVDGLQVTQGEDGQHYYYVGEFATLEQLSSYSQALSEQNPDIELVKKHIGKRTFLFIRSPQRLTQEGVNIVRAFSAYALEEKSNPSYVYR